MRKTEMAINSVLDSDNLVGFSIAKGPLSTAPGMHSAEFQVAHGGVAFAVGHKGELVIATLGNGGDPNADRVSLAFHGVDVLAALLEAVLRAGAEAVKVKEGKAPAGWDSVDGGATLAESDRPKRWSN